MLASRVTWGTRPVALRTAQTLSVDGEGYSGERATPVFSRTACVIDRGFCLLGVEASACASLRITVCGATVHSRAQSRREVPAGLAHAPLHGHFRHTRNRRAQRFRPLRSSAQRSSVLTQRSRDQFQALPRVIRSRESGSGSTQPRENN
jgi:hypothetical protein